MRVTTVIRLAVTKPRHLVRTFRFRNGPPRYRNLTRLVAERKPQTIVEIGVWRGGGAEQMIRTAAHYSSPVQYWGFDLFAEGMTDEVLKREVSLRPLTMAEVEEKLAPLGAHVTLVSGDTTITVPAADLPPIDFAFIDGGHSYETVSADWRNLRARLARDAVVVFDDYTNIAAVENEGYGIRRLIDELRGDFDVELLRPIDNFPRPYGKLEIQFAVLRTNRTVNMRGAV